VRLEGLGQMKNPITSSGIEPAIFRNFTSIYTTLTNKGIFSQYTSFKLVIEVACFLHKTLLRTFSTTEEWGVKPFSLVKVCRTNGVTFHKIVLFAVTAVRTSNQKVSKYKF
jgi:hypothetical protein